MKTGVVPQHDAENGDNACSALVLIRVYASLTGIKQNDIMQLN